MIAVFGHDFREVRCQSGNRNKCREGGLQSMCDDSQADFKLRTVWLPKQRPLKIVHPRWVQSDSISLSIEP